jgi:prepilin-type N-terminal cleavage/methylation domain-containing protein
MKNFSRQLRTKASGFSLMELMVAMAVFLVVGGAAVALFRRHVPLFSQQQSQASVNVAMRNAAAQMQIDLANAGSGYYPGINIPAWPIGVTIVFPAVGAPCFTAPSTYAAGCFDTLNIISADRNTPPANPTIVGGGCNLLTASPLYLQPIAPTTAAQLAALYNTGDEVLLVNSSGTQMSTVVLTSPGVVSGGLVQLAHAPVNANGIDPADAPPGLNITNTGETNLVYNGGVSKLGTQFCPADWAIKLSVITYSVDTTTNPADPSLVRTQNGQTNVLADQIIGFKVGAWDTVTTQYEYNTAANYGSDWSTIQSVRLSMIGRTNPVTGAMAGFTNTFDNGPYKVEGISIVVNPRNLSMNN